jgi:hypothetical protein
LADEPSNQIFFVESSAKGKLWCPIFRAHVQKILTASCGRMSLGAQTALLIRAKSDLCQVALRGEFLMV